MNDEDNVLDSVEFSSIEFKNSKISLEKGCLHSAHVTMTNISSKPSKKFLIDTQTLSYTSPQAAFLSQLSNDSNITDLDIVIDNMYDRFEETKIEVPRNTENVSIILKASREDNELLTVELSETVKHVGLKIEDFDGMTTRKILFTNLEEAF